MKKKTRDAKVFGSHKCIMFPRETAFTYKAFAFIFKTIVIPQKALFSHKSTVPRTNIAFTCETFAFSRKTIAFAWDTFYVFWQNLCNLSQNYCVLLRNVFAHKTFAKETLCSPEKAQKYNFSFQLIFPPQNMCQKHEFFSFCSIAMSFLELCNKLTHNLNFKSSNTSVRWNRKCQYLYHLVQLYTFFKIVCSLD